VTLLARAAKLAAAAAHAVAAEYRRQRHPERGWFYYARMGAGIADEALIVPRQSGKGAIRDH